MSWVKGRGHSFTCKFGMRFDLERVALIRIHSARSNSLFFTHVVIGKPVPTFPRHALVFHFRRPWRICTRARNRHCGSAHAKRYSCMNLVFIEFGDSFFVEKPLSVQAR